MKFATKLSAIFSVMLLAGSIIITYFVYTSSVKTLKTEIEIKLEEQAFHTMDKIDRMLHEEYEDMMALAKATVISSKKYSPGEITERFNKHKDTHTGYSSLAFFDMNRIRIADTSGKRIGQQHRMTKYWSSMLAGKDFDIEIYEDAVIREPAFHFAVLVKDDRGTPFGVVVAKAPVENLYGIVKQAEGRRAVGSSIEIELVDKDGLILYSNYEPENTLKEVSVDWDSIKEQLRKGDKIGSMRHLHLGEEEITSFARGQGYEFKGDDWTLIICVPTKMAFASAIELRNRMIVIFFLSGLTIILGVMFYANTISLPIRRLSHAAKEIGKGNFDVRVEVQSGDEIGELAGAFNRMAIDLKESERKYRDLAELLPQFVFELDNKGMMLFLNRYALDDLGYTRDDIAKELKAFQLFIPEDVGRVRINIEKILDGEKLGGIEYTALRKDGTTFPVVIFTAPIVEEGAISGIRGIGIDITDQKKAAEEIRRLNAELELKIEERTGQLMKAQEELARKERLTMIGQLAGGVGHELRNPLGVISNAIYFLKSVLFDANETVKEYLNIIKDEVDNSQRIISDLLDLSRTNTPQPRAISVEELVRLSLSKFVIPENIAMLIDLPDTLPYVLADSRQMGQVFQNLITNALQAMPEGGSLQIQAEEDIASRAVKMSVTDSGKGISPENIEMLFQPLFTTKARGIGLGLVISRRFAEANNGKLDVESREGKGATFTVTLPVADESKKGRKNE